MSAACARYIAAGCFGAALMLAAMIATRIPEMAGRGAGLVVRLAMIWLEPDQGRDFWRVRRAPAP